MLVSAISLLAAAATVSAQYTPAPVVANNPYGAQYFAEIKPKAGSDVSGSIEGTSMPGGQGVRFAVTFNGLPVADGPFMYHIHAKPVPADGNCTGTGAHLDPYKRGDTPACDASKPETCEVGDLSGKHGKVTTATFVTDYTDLYASTQPGDPAYFGNLSFVVHLANKTRIGCANFTLLHPGSDAPASTGFAMPSGAPQSNATGGGASPTSGLPLVPTSTITPPQFTGAATKATGGAFALLAAAVALVL